jgi:hypothetical protein
MTIERDPDQTVEMPRPIPPLDEELEEIDPEQTLVREDWESKVIRRIASHVVAVQGEVADFASDAFGWESEGLRRLSQEVMRGAK